MKKFKCFTIIPSNRENKESKLILDKKRGWVERPSGCTQVESECLTVDFDKVYTYIITPALQEVEKLCQVKIESVRGVDIKEAGDILDQLLPHICDADITITDLTTNNPNVFLEYGIRSSVKDKLNIIIAHEPVELPFNIKTQRYIPYVLADLAKADDTKKIIVEVIKKYIEEENKKYIEEENADPGAISIEKIKRNVDLYSGRKRELEMLKAFEPAPQLIAKLAGFLLEHGKEPLLKQQTIKFLESVGTMLEKDERGQERAIAHYKMMSGIQGLSKSKLEEIYLKLWEILNANPDTAEESAKYLEKVENLDKGNDHEH